MAYIRERTRGDGVTVWQVRWREGGRDGVQTSVTCATKATAKRIKGLVDAHGHLPIDAPQQLRDVTFEQLLDQHLTELTGVTMRTRADYRRLAALRFGLLAGMPVTAINRTMVAKVVNAWQAQGLSGKSIANAHGLLSGILKTGVQAKLITANPCAGIRLPRHDDHTRRDLTILTPEQYDHLLSHVRPDYRIVVDFLAATGVRWGEMVALDVADIDLARGVVSIVKAVKRDDRAGVYIGPTKTPRSRRTVTLPAYLLEDLTPRLHRPATAPLFTTATGARLMHTNFHSRIWAPALAAASDQDGHTGSGRCLGEPLTVVPRIQDLRHCHASWLLAEGVQMIVVQRRLGHESITTTIDRYSHLMPDQQAGAAEAIGRALSGGVASSGSLAGAG